LCGVAKQAGRVLFRRQLADTCNLPVTMVVKSIVACQRRPLISCAPINISWLNDAPRLRLRAY